MPVGKRTVRLAAQNGTHKPPRNADQLPAQKAGQKPKYRGAATPMTAMQFLTWCQTPARPGPEAPLVYWEQDVPWHRPPKIVRPGTPKPKRPDAIVNPRQPERIEVSDQDLRDLERSRRFAASLTRTTETKKSRKSASVLKYEAAMKQLESESTPIETKNAIRAQYGL
jgi:hypothetical protein